ncbi:MAG: aldo/keto reductase [Bacteroidota bacterium]
MEYQPLGSSDLQVSRISFGCMSLGMDEALNSRLLHRAIDLGINFFDTADLYQKGENERMLGRILKAKRKDLIIATKVGNQWRADGSGWDWNPTKAYILKAVKKSLRRLQTDYIDLYQLHGGTIDDPIDESIEAFEQLKAEGLIRHYGISSIRPNVIRTYCERSNIASIMMQYSLLDRRAEETVFEELRQDGISVIVRGGLAKGLLASKAARDYLGFTQTEVAQAGALLEEQVGERSRGQAALAYCLAEPAVATVACGISKLEQLEENAAAMQYPPLSAHQLQALKQAVRAAIYEKHR